LIFEQQVRVDFFMGRAAACFLAIYLGLSPVYCWPGVPTKALALAKFLIIASTVGLIVLDASQRAALRLPAGFAGPLGFLLLFTATIPGLLQGDAYDSLSFFKDIFLAFTMMWATYFYVISGKNIWNVIYIGAVIVGIHCALIVSSSAFNIPNWIAPPDMRILTGELSVGGFTALRTGWSQGVALFIPILFVSVLRSPPLSLFTRIITVCLFVAIIGSQLIVGGRAGLLASAMQVMIICILKKRISFGVVFVGIVALATYLNPYALDQHLRFDRLPQENKGDIEALDSFSAGRVHGAIYSLNLAMKSPVLGHGFGTIKSTGGAGEIHNVWLRLWVESGVALPIALAALIFALLRQSRYCIKSGSFNTESYKAADIRQESLARDMAITSITVLLGGVLISFFSPRTILGAFQNSAIWWVCAGTLCGLFDLARKKVPEKSVQRKVHSLGDRARRLQNHRNPLVKSLRKSGTFPTSGRRE
jgi:hypothetical protein